MTQQPEALAQPVQEPDRRALQAEGTHPAPCARHCEAKAFEIEIRGLKSALKQAQPVQEPTPWRDMIVVTLVREGINKHKARELADHFAAQPVQEPVGKVVEISSDGFRCEFNRRLAVGTKLYIAPPPPVQEPLEQLRPAEFIQLTKGKEAVTGIPAYCWSEWLNKEQP